MPIPEKTLRKSKRESENELTWQTLGELLEMGRIYE